MTLASDELLRIEDLKVHFPVTRGVLIKKTLGVVRAVDGVSFSIKRGETVGLVGESGCGKSTTGRAVLQLIKPTQGKVFFDGEEISAQWKHRLGSYQWDSKLHLLRRRMQIIFQDPYASLNPRMTVEDIISEPLRNFAPLRGRALSQKVQTLMRRVGLDPRYVRRYPHEFSGGQRQRIGIARALALEPEFIVADEPISALDVSIQAQIINLLKDLQRELHLTYLFVAHDLAAVRHISDRIVVMYLGHVAEIAESKEICRTPLHPYTKALMSAVPIPDPAVERARQRLVLVGDIPSPMHPPAGCPFNTRCPERIERCFSEKPLMRELRPGHTVACHVAT
jgi:oligopeptide transport system ATP-binding protein